MTIAYIDVAKAPVETFPRQLFFGNRQGGLYDPSDRSTLFQDTAGTVPVTADGQPVALMLDKSGRGNHLVQATLAARPIYRTNGLLHWLEFDATDDLMRSTNTLVLPSTADVMMAFAYQSDMLGSTGQVHAFGLAQNATNYLRYQVRGSADDHGFWSRSAGGVLGASTVGLYAKVNPSAIVATLKGGADYEVFRSGQSLSKVTAAGFTGLGSPVIQVGSGNFLAFRFYGGLIVLNRPSDSERALVSKLYMDKAGIIA